MTRYLIAQTAMEYLPFSASWRPASSPQDAGKKPSARRPRAHFGARRPWHLAPGVFTPGRRKDARRPTPKAPGVLGRRKRKIFHSRAQRRIHNSRNKMVKKIVWVLYNTFIFLALICKIALQYFYSAALKLVVEWGFLLGKKNLKNKSPLPPPP